MVGTSFGLWFILYAIAVGYVVLSATYPVIAGLALSSATDVIEHCLVDAINHVYIRLLIMPRRAARASLTQTELALVAEAIEGESFQMVRAIPLSSGFQFGGPGVTLIAAYRGVQRVTFTCKDDFTHLQRRRMFVDCGA